MMRMTSQGAGPGPVTLWYHWQGFAGVTRGAVTA